jgi:hypothetical protein
MLMLLKRESVMGRRSTGERYEEYRKVPGRSTRRCSGVQKEVIGLYRALPFYFRYKKYRDGVWAFGLVDTGYGHR